MNVTLVKRAMQTGSLNPASTSDPFKSKYKSDYEKKKESEKETVHKEISRVAMSNELF